MKYTFKALIIMVTLGISGVVSNTYGQFSNEEKIEKVVVKSGDGFGTLRALLKDHVDISYTELEEGQVTTRVMFSLTPEGRLSNIQATGDCSVVSTEVVAVLKHLHYKVDLSKIGVFNSDDIYSFPLTIAIANR